MTLRSETLGLRPSAPTFRALSFLALLVVPSCGGGDGSPTGPDSPVAARIELTPPADTVAYGAAVTLQAAVFDEDGARIANATVSWSTDAASVAAVDAQGRVDARGVGTTLIRATSGQASASAQLRVDPKEYVLTPARTQTMPLEQVIVPLPSEAPALAQETVAGTLGDAAVDFLVLDGHSLAFLVPDVAPGTLEVRAELNPNERVAFSLEVTAAPAISTPEEVIDDAEASVQAALDALASGGAADPTDLAAARDALASFRARVQAMSAEDRMALARLVAANPDVFEVERIQAAPSSRGPAAAEAYTPADLERFAAAIDVLVEKKRKTRTFAEACRRLEYRGPACQAAVEWGMAGGVLEMSEARTGVLEWVKERIRKAVTREDGQANQPIGTRYTAVGVRGAPEAGEGSHPSRAAAAELLLEGTTYALELDLEVRTPTADDADQGAFAPLGRTVEQFGGAWTDWNSFLSSFVDFLNGATYGMGGAAPTYVSPPQLEVRTAEQGTLGLGAVSDPQVTCTSGTVDGAFVLSCTTTALEDRDFTYAVHYTTPWETVTYEVPATIRPVHVLSYVSGSGQEGPREKPLADPLVVAVHDVTGEPVAGATVEWAVTAGGGSLSAGTALTGTDGQARATWTLGAAGAQGAMASAMGPDGAPMSGSPVAFSADLALATYVGTFTYSGVESQMTVEGISCVWQGTAEGTVRVVETAADSVSIQVNGTGDWPEGESNTPGVICGPETVTIAHEVRAEVVNGSFSFTGEGWTLTGTISGDTVSGTLSLSSSETNDDGSSYSESGQGSFTAVREDP